MNYYGLDKSSARKQVALKITYQLEPNTPPILYSNERAYKTCSAPITRLETLAAETPILGEEKNMQFEKCGKVENSCF